MTKEQNIIKFENFKIRRVFDEEKGEWYYSIVDFIMALTEQYDYNNARNYWKVLKHRLNQEGSEVVTNCNQLKMFAMDGKLRETDVANRETLFRLVQSVPSKKAEPIKLWLAKVGNERIKELYDPEQSLNRARQNWKKMGHSEKWIQQRMMGQETRNKLTDYWKEAGVKEGQEYAILTDIIHQEWSGLTTQEHKNLKGLKQENLRDNMTEAELIFTALAELSTRQIAESEKVKGFENNKIPAKKGGEIAENARKQLEAKTGKSVVSGENYLPKQNVKQKIKKLKKAN